MPLMNLDRLCATSRLATGRLLRDGTQPSGCESPGDNAYNYLLAASQLPSIWLRESPDPDADDAANDPTVVTKAHVESFQVWMIETRSASTALNKHKGLQQFFKFWWTRRRSTSRRWRA